jgi:hypothetical protein
VEDHDDTAKIMAASCAATATTSARLQLASALELAAASRLT